MYWELVPTRLQSYQESNNGSADGVCGTPSNKKTITDNHPGEFWLKGFMDRNNLPMKKANMISTARLSATSNPFIVYNFHDDTIDAIITWKRLTALQIENCDVSNQVQSHKCL